MCSRRALCCASPLDSVHVCAQSYNQTRHDYEITLEPNSVVELCEDEDTSAIPRMQYHVRLPWPPTTLTSRVGRSMCMRAAAVHSFPAAAAEQRMLPAVQ